MNQRDDAAAMVVQDSKESDAETLSERAERPTLMGLAPIDDAASDPAEVGDAGVQAAASGADVAGQTRSDIETSTVRPMQLLASDTVEPVSQADVPPVAATETAAASAQPGSLEEDDPEWLDLSTRWLITPRPRTARPLVDEDEVTEHLRWADRVVVRPMARAESRSPALPPPPPALTAAQPSRRVTMAYGRPRELPAAHAPVSAAPSAAAPTLPPMATWNGPALAPAAARPPWAAAAPAGYGAQAHYPSPIRPTREDRTPTGYTPFETGPRRRSSRRPKPSELSLELWQSISDTWLATAFKWAIALVLLHYSGLAVPVMAFFGYAPAQTALASTVLPPAAAPVAPTLAAPSVSANPASGESRMPDAKPRRVTPSRELSEAPEHLTRRYPTRVMHKPKAALSIPYQVASAVPQSAAARGFIPVQPAATQLTPYAAPVPLPAAAPESDDAAGEALLRINSRPWSQVFVDGTHVGHTPKIDLRVRAGAHRIRFVNSELGVSKTVELRASAGETVSHVQFLEE